MCGAGAIPIASLLISGMATGYQMMQSNAQADAMSASAEAAHANNMMQLDTQAQQINASASTEMMERQRQSAREQSRIITSASETGGLGGSFLTQMANARFQTGYDKAIMETNRRNEMKMNTAQKVGSAADKQSRLNEAASHRMNPMLAGLQIAGAGISAYGDYKDNKLSGLYKSKPKAKK